MIPSELKIKSETVIQIVGLIGLLQSRGAFTITEMRLVLDLYDELCELAKEVKPTESEPILLNEHNEHNEHNERNNA